MRMTNMIYMWDHSADSVRDRKERYGPCQGAEPIVSTLLLLILLVTF